MTDDLFFKDKAAAFSWYVEQGGQRQKSSFYQAIPADGKRVSRLAVSEMLRKERSKAPVVADLSGRRELADTEKAEADARSAKVRADEAERELSDKWLLKDDAHAQMAALFGLLRDALRHHAHRASAAVIHLSGGEASRAAEVYEGIEQEIFAPAFNEVAGAGRVEVMFEGGEE